jgi:ABC-2 type transport system ATP-binding protein
MIESGKTSELIVKTEHLTKKYGGLTAVGDLNLQIHRKDVFGFLGPNGSGKTTTISMLLSLVRPTSGRIEIFSQNLTENLPSILPRIGAVMDKPGLYPYLSGRDNLSVLARITGGNSYQRIDDVLKQVDLFARANDKFQTYSLGMKQRLAIAGALLHDPELIILDEPTNGLDPAGMKEVRELIISLKQQGKTIFLSSHLLHEVEQVCDHVAIVKQGKIIAQGQTSHLLHSGGGLQLKVTDTDKALALLKGVQWIPSVSREDNTIEVDVPPDRAPEISAILARNDIFLYEMKAKENTLEEFFLEVTEK